MAWWGDTVEVLPGILFALVVFAADPYGSKARKAGNDQNCGANPQESLAAIAPRSNQLCRRLGRWHSARLHHRFSQRWPLADLIALLGLGSVAIGFAFQDIFKNFLSGILLLLQEPFSLGDQIIVGEYEGTVAEIALRSTQIRTYRGELVVVPNSIVFTSPVQVMTGRPQRRTDLAIGVDYNTPLPMAVSTLAQAAKSVEEIKHSPSIEVDIVGFGDSSIDLVVRYWTNSEQKSVRRIKTQMMIALKQACDDADIGIPYPIRTIYTL